MLAVRDPATREWGALGLSRRRELAAVLLGAPGLAALVASYVAGYDLWGHEVIKVRAGLPAPHDPAHSGHVCWR